MWNVTNMGFDSKEWRHYNIYFVHLLLFAFHSEAWLWEHSELRNTHGFIEDEDVDVANSKMGRICCMAGWHVHM